MSALSIHHFILTRFSYRLPNQNARTKFGADWFMRHDPLDPGVLEYRFALFELVCLPNILAQTTQDFDWIIIVDPGLPPVYRQRLERLLSGKARTHFHEISASDHLDRLGWLRKHIPADTQYVLTTLLDDDDILPVRYIEKLQAHIKGIDPAIPEIMTVGVKRSYQWDIYASRKYPFGTLAPWHRQQWFRSAGFSILCEISKHQLTCFALSHTAGDIWFETGSAEDLSRIMQERWGIVREPHMYHKVIRSFQQRLSLHTGTGGNGWKTRPANELSCNFSEDGAFVIQTNHFLNDQDARLLEHKPEAKRVVETDFISDNLRIDWNSFHQHRDLFKLSWKQYIKYMREFILIAEQSELNFRERILLAATSCSRLTWWFLRH